jgi:hypothetical protein
MGGTPAAGEEYTLRGPRRSFNPNCVTNVTGISTGSHNVIDQSFDYQQLPSKNSIINHHKNMSID